MKKINLGHLMIAVLVTYIPFHLFEEALGNFPSWMFQHHWMPIRLTYGHWMAGNIFFYFPLLMAGVFAYFLFGEKFLSSGFGVIIWGLLNFIEHSIYTIMDMKVSPGLLSSIIFLSIAVLGFLQLKKQSKLKPGVIIPSLVCAIIFAFVPIILQMTFSPVFRSIFI